jgi:Glycerophosphoryl diester phosphodiesterase
VTAHRGASGYAPENTIASFKKAIELGADFSELDAQETSDGVLIVNHDGNYKRTAESEKNVWET